MSRKGRSASWINARKAINDKINNQTWWEKHFGKEFSQEKIELDINELPADCETHLSLDDVFDMNYLLSVLIDEQILFECILLLLSISLLISVKYVSYVCS